MELGLVLFRSLSWFCQWAFVNGRRSLLQPFVVAPNVFPPVAAFLGRESLGDDIIEEFPVVADQQDGTRSDERRVGNKIVSTCQSRGWPHIATKNQNTLL